MTRVVPGMLVAPAPYSARSVPLRLRPIEFFVDGGAWFSSFRAAAHGSSVPLKDDEVALVVAVKRFPDGAGHPDIALCLSPLGSGWATVNNLVRVS